MSSSVESRCRVQATRELDSPLWSFYFINDSLTTIESAELFAVKYEWGDQYVGSEGPGVSIEDLAPGAKALLWQDDGSSEMRTDLWLRLRHQGAETWLLFEFPRLHRQQGTILIAHPIRVEGPPLV